MPGDHGGPAKPDTGLMLGVLTVEASGVVLLLALHRIGDRSLSTVLPTKAGVMVVVAAVALVLGILLTVRRSRSTPRRQRALTLMLNAFLVIATASLAELAMRGLAHDVYGEEKLASQVLFPRSWSVTATEEHKLIELLPDAFLVPDRDLGWCIAPGRSSKDGLYHSSVEGVRDIRPGRSLKNVKPEHRIALVGDSFTFGSDVAYEDTWGAALGRKLGKATQVVNFGISGFGVDQTYLRYMRDVRSWHPDVVVFGVYPDDLSRSLNVYTFIRRPHWQIPFSKPRLVVRDGRLVNVNTPLESPSETFSHRSITDLPFVDLDADFCADQWQQHWYDVSYLVRFAVSRSWPLHDLGGEIVTLNSAILEQFVATCSQAGSVPLIIYLPSADDVAGKQTAKEKAFTRLHVSSVDLTPVVARAPTGQRFVAGGHYSPRVNLGIADVLEPKIRALLSPAPVHGSGK